MLTLGVVGCSLHGLLPSLLLKKEGHQLWGVSHHAAPPHAPCGAERGKHRVEPHKSRLGIQCGLVFLPQIALCGSNSGCRAGIGCPGAVVCGASAICCVCVCVHVCSCLHVGLCMCMYAYVCRHVHVCMHICM